ncbi:helix-turn-helix domain-containing protein [Spirochaeta cellobiosiphila]|uniref:helix-turn-helix domain-containing protein n=1 Tax=Spirochaeta cellobiosiphila TaxID=504483 RepID=UPI001B7FAED5|nr:helix-turn-helix domain-containing protein [Spirochaeta cellobiosiphila]
MNEHLKIWTKDYHKKQRFEAWSEALNNSHMGWSLDKRDDTVYGYIKMHSMGRFKLSNCSCYSPCSGSRAGTQIARENTSYYAILTVQNGYEVIKRRGKEQKISNNDIYLWDTNETLSFRSYSAIEKNTLFVEKDFLEKLFPQVTQMIGKVFDGKQGLGPFIHSNLMTLSSRFDTLDPHSTSIITDSTLELLSTWMLRLNPVTTTGHRTKLFNQISKHIKKNLNDPDLCPGKIAKDFGISLRSLHQLFSSTETSVSQMIRQQRLEQCRHEIVRNKNPKRTITEIALQWGFNDSSHFSKCFKEMYNVSPRQYLSSRQ